MYHEDTEILFPMRVAPELRELRGPEWRELVDEACRAAEDSPERLAFCLMLIRMSNCLTCHPHSYRALRGCTTCARQSVRRFRGEDHELRLAYERARIDIESYMNASKTITDNILAQRDDSL